MTEDRVQVISRILAAKKQERRERFGSKPAQVPAQQFKATRPAMTKREVATRTMTILSAIKPQTFAGVQVSQLSDAEVTELLKGLKQIFKVI